MLDLRKLLVAIVLLAPSAQSKATECVAKGPIPASTIFIGYTRSNDPVLYSAALLQDGSLVAYDGRNLTVGMQLHDSLASPAVVGRVESVSPFLDIRGDDHCEYPALLDVPASQRWRLWASSASSLFRTPTSDERSKFRAYRPECVRPGDPAEDDNSCLYAELIAISDIDGDTMPEYWHTTLYKWDVGLSVSERVDDSNFVELLSVCPGCSD